MNAVSLDLCCDGQQVQKLDTLQTLKFNFIVKTLKQLVCSFGYVRWASFVERGHTINLQQSKETSWITISHLYGFTLLTCTYYLIKSYQMCAYLFSTTSFWLPQIKLKWGELSIGCRKGQHVWLKEEPQWKTVFNCKVHKVNVNVTLNSILETKI